MAAHVLIVDDDPVERRRIEQMLSQGHSVESASGALGLGDIITRSPSMERVHRLAERAARSSIPVLVEGERGVGKELLARAIHGSSARRGRAFVAVRCEGLDEAKIESALLGEQGGDKKSGGKIRDANCGTLFLDEIGALSHNAQARLARVLAEGETEAAARGHRLRSDIRLIAATSRRLIDLVSQDGFHEALFNRLNVLPIWLPPLRERRADIPALARGLLARLAAEAGGFGVSGISAEAISLLVAHDWPGNVRELERAVFRAVMLSGGGDLVPTDFSQLIASAGILEGPNRTRASNASLLAASHAGVAVQKQAGGERYSAAAAVADRSAFARYGVARLLDELGEMRPIGALEEEVIRFAIGHYRGQMSEVARRLGIGRSTLYRKLKDYGIAPGEPVAS